LLIKYIKSVLWRVAKCLSYIEEARCLKVNSVHCHQNLIFFPTQNQNYFLTPFLFKAFFKLSYPLRLNLPNYLFYVRVPSVVVWFYISNVCCTLTPFSSPHMTVPVVLIRITKYEPPIKQFHSGSCHFLPSYV